MVRLIIITCVAVVGFFMLGGLVLAIGSGGKQRSWDANPGKQGFDEVNTQIVGYHGLDALGNTTDAVKIGQAFSQELAAIREVAFTGGGDAQALSLSSGHFITYCQESGDDLLIICHVPQLRKFAGDAKAALMGYAWKTAQHAVLATHPDHHGKVYVGLRGIALYYEIWIGTAHGAPAQRLPPDAGLKAAYALFAPKAGGPGGDPAVAAPALALAAAPAPTPATAPAPAPATTPAPAADDK